MMVLFMDMECGGLSNAGTRRQRNIFSEFAGARDRDPDSI